MFPDHPMVDLKVILILCMRPLRYLNFKHAKKGTHTKKNEKET